MRLCQTLAASLAKLYNFANPCLVESSWKIDEYILMHLWFKPTSWAPKNPQQQRFDYKMFLLRFYLGFLRCDVKFQRHRVCLVYNQSDPPTPIPPSLFLSFAPTLALQLISPNPPVPFEMSASGRCLGMVFCGAVIKVKLQSCGRRSLAAAGCIMSPSEEDD